MATHYLKYGSKEASISYLNLSANFCTLHIDPCMCNNMGRTRLLPCTCNYYRSHCFVLQCFHWYSLSLFAGLLWLHVVNPWSHGYGTWSVCVCVSVSLCVHSNLIYLVQLHIKQEICTSDFCVTWVVKIKRHFVEKFSVRKLEHYLLTTNRLAILSNIYFPQTFPLHVRARHCALLPWTYNMFTNKYACLLSCIVNHCTEDLHFSAFNTCVFSAVVK